MASLPLFFIHLFMLGTFASVEKRVIGQGTCVAYKTYSKAHGQLVFRHYKRELWALKKLAVVSKEGSVQNHVNDTCLVIQSNVAG